MTETTTRIRWTDDPARGETLGWVGSFGRAVFRIWPPDEEGERILLVYLAGEAQHMYHDDSEDAESALKAKAEELLAGFVSSLGAVFPEDETSDDDDEPPEVMWAAGRRVRFAHPGAGYPGEAEDAARHLTPGGVYTIAWADVGQSRTDLNLAAGGKSAGRYNSVFFEPADDREAAVKAAGERDA